MTTPDAASLRYAELDSWARLQELVSNAEAEGLHLEAKAPQEPRLTREQKEYLGKAASGFANTAGGVIIWGISTTKHAHSGLDILTQLEPIGNCNVLRQIVQRTLPTLTTPPLPHCATKLLVEKPADTRGILVTYIPHHPSAPVQCNSDQVFYFRSGDDFHPAPYEVLRRLFAYTDIPDLQPLLEATLVERSAGQWTFPIIMENHSAAAAENVLVSITFENPSACDSINVVGYADQSGVNPGRHIFSRELPGLIYKDLNSVIATVAVKMKVGKRPKRRLAFTVTTYARRMIARRTRFVVQLAQKGFAVRVAKPVPVT